MRCVQIQGSFGLDSLVASERQELPPGPGEIAVRLRAASLNFRDLMMVQGLYNPKQPLPLIPCSDGVGVIDAIGPGVSAWRVGDRVIGCFAPSFVAGEPSHDKIKATLGGPLDGTLAERIVLPAAGVVAAPKYLDDAGCATLPCAAVTAYNAVVEQGGVRPGDVVLVQGTGGVALFALQVARLCGAEVIVTSSSDDKLERARSLGAWQTINYKKDADWGGAAKKLTGGRGVDLVIEVGGAGTIEQSLRAVRVGGRVMIIGVLAGAASQLLLTRVLMQNIRLQGVLVGSRETFEAMNRAFTVGKVQPIIDKVFALSEAKAAFQHLGSGAHFGKIVVQIA